MPKADEAYQELVHDTASRRRVAPQDAMDQGRELVLRPDGAVVPLDEPKKVPQPSVVVDRASKTLID